MARPRLQAPLAARRTKAKPDSLTDGRLSSISFDCLFHPDKPTCPQAIALSHHCLDALATWRSSTPPENQARRNELLLIVRAARDFKSNQCPDGKL